MAKARAIVKRRKAVRNIRKITKTMQMIATARFQKALKRAVGIKPFTLKLREMVRDLAESAGGEFTHPLLLSPPMDRRKNRIALVVVTSDRGLAGAYNGNVLRAAQNFLRRRQQAGLAVDLYVAGKKGVAFFNFRKQPITQRLENISDNSGIDRVSRAADEFMRRFTAGEVDSVHVAYMNFISTGVQRAEIMQLLPLGGIKETTEHLAQQVAEQEAQVDSGSLDEKRLGDDVRPAEHIHDTETIYDFSPNPRELLIELLPYTVRVALYQAFLDAVTSENVARMVSMKSATDNADKMIKSLTMQYNRARQSQITTELSEIMGGVEAMNG